jgi:hypothetical protein
MGLFIKFFPDNRLGQRKTQLISRRSDPLEFNTQLSRGKFHSPATLAFAIVTE